MPKQLEALKKLREMMPSTPEVEEAFATLEEAATEEYQEGEEMPPEEEDGLEEMPADDMFAPEDDELM